MRKLRVALHRARFATMLPLSAPRLFARLYSAGFYRQMHETWLDVLAPARGSTAIDVGCGPGDLALALARRGVVAVGLDRSSAMVDAARRRAESALCPPVYAVADACQLASRSASADLVLASSLLNVVDNPVNVLRQLKRTSREGGIVSVLLPAPEFGGESAAAYAEQRRMEPSDAALLELWAGAARKVAPEQARTWFDAAGLAGAQCEPTLDGFAYTLTAVV